MTVFSLIKNGYDTYSSSMLMFFGWGSVIFCAVIALVLSKMKDRQERQNEYFCNRDDDYFNGIFMGWVDFIDPTFDEKS